MNSVAYKELPRLALTFAIIALFAYGIFAHYSNGLEETLKNIVMLAVGFWLGSSKGTADANERSDKIIASNTVTTGEMNVDAEKVNLEKK